MSPPIILWTYPESPFGQKLAQVLQLKQLPYHLIKVPPMPPRSELIDSLGITYRRIPILAIGNDIYLDTSLSIIALDRLFPSIPLLPKSIGLQKGAALFWADRAVFHVAGGLLPWDEWPVEFVEDRARYLGKPLDPVAIRKNFPAMESALRGHLVMIEEQLSTRSSSSHFLLDTPTPMYLDLCLAFTLSWIATFQTAPHLFTSFPLVASWLALVTSSLSSLAKHSESILSASEGAELVHAAQPDEGECVEDSGEPLIREGWMKVGDEVEIAPTDTGMEVLQKGTLVGLNPERVVVEVKGKEGRTCRVHAPRLGFSVALAS